MWHELIWHSIYVLRTHMIQICVRPRMEKSHSCWPRTVWCVVNMFHKNEMRPVITANGTRCYWILYCNSPWLYIRLKYTYSVISVKVDSLPGNSKKGGIDLFVAFGVQLVHSLAGHRLIWYYSSSSTNSVYVSRTHTTLYIYVTN